MIIGVVVYQSDSISHFFTKLSCSLSDGSNYDCGSGGSKNHHIVAAAIFFISAIAAFVGNRWASRSSATWSGPLGRSMAARRNAVQVVVGLLAIAGFLTVRTENDSALHKTNVGAMARILQRADIPSLQGDVEQLDSGGQQFFGTAPVHDGDIAAVCQAFLDAVSRIESQHMLKKVTTESDQVTSCVNQISVVVDAPMDGTVYPTGSFHVAGLYRPSSSGDAVDFWAILSLNGGRGSNPATPYPQGYQWSVSISQQ